MEDNYTPKQIAAVQSYLGGLGDGAERPKLKKHPYTSLIYVVYEGFDRAEMREYQNISAIYTDGTIKHDDSYLPTDKKNRAEFVAMMKPLHI